MQARLRSPYLKGYRLERAVKKALENSGFFVVRAASSKPIDLVAVKFPDVLIVECKASPEMNAANISFELFKTYRIPAVAVVKKGGTLWEWALTCQGNYVREDTLKALRSALGNIYTINREGHA